jgi:hypothetical protein
MEKVIQSLFTPLENPAIYGRGGINETSIPYRKDRVKAPYFLMGFAMARIRMDKHA